MSRFSGRTATVMGLGLFGGGAAAARYLCDRGARVTVTDRRPAGELTESLREIADLPVKLVLGRHDPGDIASAEIVVVNPAVDPRLPELERARERGARVTSEVALFLEICPARIAAVTGTQGKSSTCHILASILEAAGLRTHLGGNIGRPLLPEADSMSSADVAVVELSSYQLEALATDEPLARAEVVGVTNVLADHLERHGTVKAYAQAKARILELLAPGGTAVLASDAAELRRAAPGPVTTFARTEDATADLSVAGDAFCLRGTHLAPVEALRVPGRFQRANALLALGMAARLGVQRDAFAAGLRAAEGLEHRFQDLGLIRGVRVLDNGVSTTPDATLAALRSIESTCVLLCGGQMKSLDYEALAHEARDRACRVVTFGADGARLADVFERAGRPALVVNRVEDAVHEAFDGTREGEVLLFSPSCASFDAYRNFRDRAAAFRACLPRAGGSV